MGSSAIYNGSANVQGNDTLWMSNIRCIGNESSLVSCVHGGWTHLGCAVGQTAGVMCTGDEGKSCYHIFEQPKYIFVSRETKK